MSEKRAQEKKEAAPSIQPCGCIYAPENINALAPNLWQEFAFSTHLQPLTTTTSQPGEANRSGRRVGMREQAHGGTMSTHPSQGGLLFC